MKKTRIFILLYLLFSLSFVFPAVNGGNAYAAETNSIEVLVTSWCPYCQALEKYLDTKGYKYTRFDIEKNDKGMKRHLELGGGGVPVVVVNGTVVRGFNPIEIERNIKR